MGAASSFRCCPNRALNVPEFACGPTCQCVPRLLCRTARPCRNDDAWSAKSLTSHPLSLGKGRGPKSQSSHKSKCCAAPVPWNFWFKRLEMFAVLFKGLALVPQLPSTEVERNRTPLALQPFCTELRHEHRPQIWPGTWRVSHLQPWPRPGHPHHGRRCGSCHGWRPDPKPRAGSRTLVQSGLGRQPGGHPERQGASDSVVHRRPWKSSEHACKPLSGGWKQVEAERLLGSSEWPGL